MASGCSVSVSTLAHRRRRQHVTDGPLSPPEASIIETRRHGLNPTWKALPLTLTLVGGGVRVMIKTGFDIVLTGPTQGDSKTFKQTSIITTVMQTSLQSLRLCVKT